MIKTLKNIFLVFLCLISIIACETSKEEKVKAKMEQELLEDFGEEFVVENIGLREANGIKFYQASIYPKSIIGTPKEEDSYYYSTASVDVSRLNKPRSVGSSYGVIKMNDEAEEYLILKAKELFGDKIRLKANIEYLEKEEDYYVTFLENGFKEKKELIIKEPEKYRMYVNLYIYVFDKIDNEKEKEERRKQLFEFLQYLRGEGLDRYLAIDCNFMDDIVLAPSFQDKKYILELSDDKEEKASIEKKLREEVEKIDEKEILNNMDKIRKSEFRYEYETISTNYTISILQMVSIDYLKDIDMHGRYEEAINLGELGRHYYKNSNDFDYFESNENIFKKGEN